MKDTLITIAILAVLLGGGYWWYVNYSEPAVVVAPESPIGGPTLDLIERLRTVRIDTTIFSDPIFLELEPAPALILENFTRGRNNPFLPIQ